MKNFQRPIEKLKEDVRFYQTQLVEAKIQHKHALSSGSDLLAKRLENRIHYFERRIAVSRTELSRMQALYDMSPKDQLVARLIHANKFDMNRRDVLHTSQKEMSLRGAERRGNLTEEEQVSELTEVFNLYKERPDLGNEGIVDSPLTRGLGVSKKEAHNV